MDSTISSFLLPIPKGGQATQDAINTPFLNSYGAMNVHFGSTLGAAMERRAVVEQRMREGDDKGEPIDGVLGSRMPIVLLGLAALGFIIWRAM